jgi:hypothetical protein
MAGARDNSDLIIRHRAGKSGRLAGGSKAVHVVGEDNPGIDVEGAFRAGGFDGDAE